MSQQLHDIIHGTIRRLTEAMGLACDIHIGDATDGVLEVTIRTDMDANLLIGKNGQNLAALEHIIRAASYRNTDNSPRVVVDVNDYRQNRAEQLVQMTRQVVSRVRDTRRSQALLPMAPHERRIVHMELASYTDVASESIGEGENRRVVIKPLSF